MGELEQHDDDEREEHLDEEAELELAARRLVALSRVRQYGDPVLRMKGREVESYDDDLQRLVERMTRLMHEAQGVGLAATQVGVLRRLFVFEPDEEGPRAIVNRVIVEKDDELATDNEGCLSLQGIKVPVERSTRIVLEGKDENGED